MIMEALKLLIDSEGTDAGVALLSPDGPGGDERLWGRFGNADGGRVYVENYDGVYVEASSRAAAARKLVKALGYPRGTKISIRYER
jgi:hypothetical protein